MAKRTNKRTTADTNMGGTLILVLFLFMVLCVLMGIGALGAVVGL